MTDLVVSARLTLGNKGYVTGIQQAESQTKRLNDGARALTDTLKTVLDAKARDVAAWGEMSRNNADLAAQYRQQAAAAIERGSAADRFVAGLRREAETMGLSRAEMVRYEARQLALTEAQKRLVEQFARKVDAPKLQTIDQQGVDAATRALAQNNQALTLTVRNTMALERAEAQLDAQLAKGLISQAQHAAALRRVQTELNGTGSAAYAGQALALTEGYQKLQAQLKLTSDNSYQLEQAQGAVLRIAKDTGGPLNEMGQLWGRLAPVMKEAGYAQSQVGDISEIVAKSLRLSNASTAESASTMLQFSQSMASGVMRGEEFNSLMENSPVLMRKLAEGLGVPVGALRKMAEEGELTADRVVAALLKSKDAIDRDFAKMPKTVSMAWQSLTNEVTLSLGEFDKGVGVTQGLAKAIDVLTENLGTVATAIGVVVGTAGTLAVLTPIGATLAVAAGAAVALAKGLDLIAEREQARYAEQEKALRQQEAENKIAKEINAARLKMREIKAPEGYEEALVQINQAMREGRLDAKEAGAAMNAYVEAANAGAAKLAKAKSNFENFLPNAAKVKKALADLDAEYKLMQEAGLASESVYQARRGKIIQEALKDEIKVRADLLKEANKRELTDEQQKIAAIIEEKNKRLREVSGNAALITATERNAVAEVARVILAGEQEKAKTAKDGAAARVKATEEALRQSLDAEKTYIDRIRQLQESIVGIQQSAADKISEIRRKGMSESQAEADRQEEISKKFSEAEALLKKGEGEAAVAIAKKAEALASVSTNLGKQEEAVKRATEIEIAAQSAQQAAAEAALIAQKQKTDELSQSLDTQRQALDRVSSAVIALDARLAAARRLDIDTGPALSKIAEVKSRLAEIAAASLPLDASSSLIDTSTDGYATGGRIRGPGTPTSDSILLRGSVDEFMVRAASARRVGYAVMDYINRYGELPPGHATGGRIGQPAPALPEGFAANPSASDSAIGGNTYHIAQVVLPDVRDVHGFVRQLEERSRTRPLRINTMANGRRNG